uniref:Hypothetical chloroplast RF1 n=1 Tax=Pseudochloris wilhelmii TaxID=1418016 RepID=A0A097KQR8_9CHLO|nr:hypothetical chloroplast RF1 [Pseudochloris wilhelmii]AIT95544.1 hypothetical chloroplast RF1 [Pseudochloris wilhelmii]
MISFVSTIRDLLELVSPFEVDSILQKTSFPVMQAITTAGSYVLNSIPAGLFYLISGQWIRDYTILPITAPEYTSSVINEYPIFDLDLSGMGISILDVPHLKENTFILGLINSFFLAFPNSLIYVIAFRRLFFFGKPAAIYTLGGYLLGQWLFITCCILGIRAIIIPWVTWEPFPFFLGFALLWNIFYEFLSDNCLDTFRSNRLKSTWSFSGIGYIYKKYIITSFLLAWCEQSAMFQYLANVNGTPLASFLELPAGSGFIHHIFYLFGLLAGIISFTALLIQIGSVFSERLLYIPFVDANTSIQFKRNLNKTLMFFGVFVCANLPFYATDYLVTAPLGFISGDHVFSNEHSPFNKYNNADRVDMTPNAAKLTPDRKSSRKFQKGETLMGHTSAGQSLDVDTSDLDRGRYLVLPSLTDNPWGRTRWGFEDLNKRGEMWWKHQTIYVNGGMKREHSRKNWTAKRFTEKFFPEHNQRYDSFQKLLTVRIEPRMKTRAEQVRFADQFSIGNTQTHLEKKNQSETFSEIIYPQAKSGKGSRFETNFLTRHSLTTSKPSEKEESSIDPWETAFGFTKQNGYNDVYRTSAANAFPMDFTSNSWLARQQPNGLQQLRLSAQTQTPIVELLCKKKYYTNPLYKLLLQIDIDFFLNRQPRRYQLSGAQEFDLYQKREILNAYSDSLRAYTQMPGYSIFESVFSGPKSFANKVYNQQFKGTLKLIGRRFALTVDPTSNYIQNIDDNEQGQTEEEFRNEITLSNDKAVDALRNHNVQPSINDQLIGNPKYNRDIQNILKFDQPLYRQKNKSPIDFWHEELKPIAENDIIESEMTAYSIPQWEKAENLDIHNRDLDDISSPLSALLPLGSPIYAGWDNTNRQFILSSKLLPRELAGYVLNIPTQKTKSFMRDKLPEKPFSMKFGRGVEYEKLDNLENTSQHIRFTSWPLSDTIITSPKSLSLYPFETMMDSPVDPMYAPSFLKKDFVIQAGSDFDLRKNKNWKDQNELIFFEKIANRLKGFYRDHVEMKAVEESEPSTKEGDTRVRNHSIVATRHIERNGTESELGSIRSFPVHFSKEQLHLRTLPSSLRRLKQEILDTARETTALKIIRDQIKTEQIQLKKQQSDFKTFLGDTQVGMSNTIMLPITESVSKENVTRNVFLQKVMPKSKLGKKRLSGAKRQELREKALLEQFSEYEDPRIAQFLFEEQFRYLAPRRGGFIWPGNAQPRFMLSERKLPRQVVPVKDETSSIETLEQKMLETLTRR